MPDEPTKPKRGRPSGGSKKAARGKANQARQSSGSSSGGYSGGSSNEGSTSDDNQASDAASEAGEPRGAGEARRAPEPPPVSTVALRAELFLHDARGRLSETPAHHITLNSLDRISRQLTWRQATQKVLDKAERLFGATERPSPQSAAIGLVSLHDDRVDVIYPDPDDGESKALAVQWSCGSRDRARAAGFGMQALDMDDFDFLMGERSLDGAVFAEEPDVSIRVVVTGVALRDCSCWHWLSWYLLCISC